jgi:hypothetical protein
MTFAAKQSNPLSKALSDVNREEATKLVCMWPGNPPFQKIFSILISKTP